MRTATIYNFLIEANIMAGLAILLMLIVRKFFRKYLGSRVICFAWLLVSIRLLCPLALPNPMIHEIRSPFAPDKAIRPIAGQVQVRVSDALSDAYIWSYRNSGPAQESSVTQTLKSLDSSLSRGILARDLMKIYCTGAVGVIGWFIFANVRFRRRLRADRIEALTGDLMDEYLALCSEMGIKPLPVYYVDPLPSACLAGVFRPYIALPLTASPQETLPILKHEICHYRGRDHIWALVRLICCAVHWFNPLIWLAASLSRTDGELACDERVTRDMDGGQKKEYAGILVYAAAKKNAPGLPVLATGMTMTGKKLKTRVKSILDGKPVKMLSAAFAALAGCLLIGAFATAEYTLPSRNLPIPQAPEVTFEEMENEEAMIRHGEMIWALIGRSTEGAEWEVTDSPYKPAYAQLIAHLPSDDTLALHMGKNGEVITLMVNGNYYYDGDVETFRDNDPWREALRDYAMDVLLALNPDAFEAGSPVFDRGDRLKDGRRYALFEVFPTDGSSITVIVDVTDKVQVVSFHLGNG
ncbi:MAG: M56 family metallopeptidase [Clostridiales bacterium]|nr:M56 family metallopeptidase [Clostridiales bacterium]